MNRKFTMIPSVIGRLKTASNRTAPLLSCVRQVGAYDGEGKTTVRVINQELDMGLMVDSYSVHGFRLNNGIAILGPLAIFPRTVLSWQVTSSELITEHSLRFFKLLQPKLDLIVIGLETHDRSAYDRVLAAARRAGLNAEVQPTEHAASTFNFLNAEGRSVAGALIPPRVVPD